MKYPALTVPALRGLAGLLRKFRKKLEWNPEQLPTPELVEIARELWTLMDEANALNNAIKDRLRELAGDAEKTEFEGENGSAAHVYRSTPRLVLRSDVSTVELKRRLNGKFHLLFTEHHQIRPNASFNDEVLALDPETREYVLNAVDIQASPARVSIK
jgi:hypothetical protein